MDSHRDHCIRVCRVPVWLAGSAVAAAVWLPAHDAFHYGQVTPLLCGILAAGLGRTPFWRGLLVGLATAIKPTFGILIPFVGIAFGPMALVGGILGALPAVIHVPWFMEYLRFLPEVSQRFFACPSPVRYLGPVGSVAVTSLLCLAVALMRRNRESTYVTLIGIVTVGTALWPHSYCPAIIPLCYAIGRMAGNERPT